MAKLTLGWKLTDDNHPTAWLRQRSPGHVDKGELMFTVDASAMENHAILFAQSGSGKSFFIGRLLEELVLHTSCRIVVIDPNSDYANIAQVNDAIYNDEGYDVLTGAGVLPTETTADGFRRIWCPDHIELVGRDMRAPLCKLDPRLFLGATTEESATRVQCVHQFLQILTQYLTNNWAAVKDKLDAGREGQVDIDSLQRALTMFQHNPSGFPEDFGNLADTLQNERNTPGKSRTQRQLADLAQEIEKVRRANARLLGEYKVLKPFLQSEMIEVLRYRIHQHRETFQPVDDGKNLFEDPKLYVVDKPGLPQDIQYTLLHYCIQQLWELHRKSYRDGSVIPCPTFLFIDEAHHLMPRDTQNHISLEILRESLRDIAAEGRKFGLFLFLISQRPDKLDPLIVSECQNKLIMRVGSLRALQEAAPTLGLTDIQVADLSEAAKFKQGRAFALGPIAEESSAIPNQQTGSVKFYVAARRTVEGGKKVSKEWRSGGLMGRAVTEPPMDAAKVGGSK